MKLNEKSIFQVTLGLASPLSHLTGWLGLGSSVLQNKDCCRGWQRSLLDLSPIILQLFILNLKALNHPGLSLNCPNLLECRLSCWHKNQDWSRVSQKSAGFVIKYSFHFHSEPKFTIILAQHCTVPIYWNGTSASPVAQNKDWCRGWQQSAGFVTNNSSP